MWTEITEYARLVVLTWYGLVAGAIMAAIGFYERLAKRPLTKVIYAAVLIVLLLVSPFFVWRTEHRARETATAERDGLVVTRDSLAAALAESRDSLAAVIARGPELAADARDARSRQIRDRISGFIAEADS